MAFAKLFESEAYGQILVKVDANDKGEPEVRYFFQPEGLGVCSCAASFTDDDAGWDKAETLFAAVDVAQAEVMVAGVINTGLTSALANTSPAEH